MSATQAIQLALENHRAGRLAEAEKIYRDILATEPRNADALHLLGLIAQQVGRHADAVTLLQRAATINPNRGQTLASLGASLGVLGRVDDAAVALSRAVHLQPDLADAHVNLGNVFQSRGELAQAIACFDRAVHLDPNLATARANRGRALMTLNRPQQAIDDFAAVVRVNPNDAQNHFQLGLAQERSDRLDDAAASYCRSIAIDPALAEAHYNLAACLSAGGEAAEVIAHMTEALRLRPDLTIAQEKLLHQHHYADDVDPRASLERHRTWAARRADPLTAAAPPHRSDRDENRRLRIGYVSPDFRRHSVAYFLEPLLAAHDKSQVEVFCYADEIKRDAVTARLQSHANTWRAINGLPDEQLAQIIRGDRIDILIDLAGHVDHNRLLAFARRPAPVQVSYLGYPDTTGMRGIDYRLTDAIADPPGDADTFYAEKLIRLPGCAWCYRPDDDAPPPDRDSDAGEKITFGCFNVASKINAPLIASWAAILRAVPNSKMIIKDGQGTPSPAIPRLRREFARHGFGEDRVEMLSYVHDVAAHLGLYRRTDIALDTHPYNGTTTTCEALWMGVPVMTLTGRHHLSRVGSSLLTAVGRPDLIAESRDAYIAMAVRLAGQGPRTSQQRRDLREQMKSSPLMDANQFARSVEAAFREMWRTYARG